MTFPDDAVIVSLLKGKEMSHGPVTDCLLRWCQEAFLELNVTKTKDMCIEFRCLYPNPVNTKINGQNVEIVESYQYLGIIIDNKLGFD